MVAIERSVETGARGGHVGRCLIRLGIFAKTFVRPSLEGALDAVASRPVLRPVQHGLRGLPTLPEAIERRRRAGGDGGPRPEMAAVSGTFNMIDPDPATRERGCGGSAC